MPEPLKLPEPNLYEAIGKKEIQIQALVLEVARLREFEFRWKLHIYNQPDREKNS